MRIAIEIKINKLEDKHNSLIGGLSWKNNLTKGKKIKSMMAKLEKKNQ